MKRCPQCDAEYDDHVEYCFVDGAQLVRQTEAPRGTSLPPPPEASPSSRLLPVVLALAGAAVVTLIVVAVVLLYLIAVPDPPSPVDDAPVEVPPTPSEVAKLEPEQPLRQVTVRSQPSGASVWEGTEELCAATPCEVPHPTHAPIPRTFRVRLGGYEDGNIEMVDASRAYEIQLRRVARPVPAPAPVVRPRPTQEPAPSSVPRIMDER